MSKRSRINIADVPEGKSAVISRSSPDVPGSIAAVEPSANAKENIDASPLLDEAASVVAPITEVAVLPMSPSTNRDRFRNSNMPMQLSCDLSSMSAEPGFRFTFQAVVLVVFPSSSNPLRRHVLVGDGRGTVGVTVWNAHVNAFSFQSIGQLVVISKVSMTVHNGVRGISLNKESAVSFSSEHDHFGLKWWKSIPSLPALPAIIFHDQKDNAVINICGILGSVTVEQKNVRSDARELLTLKLVDRTGIVTVRSWNHGAGLFQAFMDKPVLIQRVRVTSFGGMKIAELFDGNGSVITGSDFPGASDLNDFWSQ